MSEASRPQVVTLTIMSRFEMPPAMNLGGKHMKLTPRRRNELDRARQSKAIRMAHYELSGIIGAMYFVDRVGFAPSDKWYALAALVLAIAILWLWDSRSLRSIEKQLEQDALKEDVEEVIGGD
jgi:hypothetical protein